MIDPEMLVPKADIVVCGPEASGTRALAVNIHRLCQPHGKVVRHLSLPLGEEWWTAADVVGEQVVVITRRPDYQATSAFKQGCTVSREEAAAEWPRAIATLALIPGAYWVLYEAMVADPVSQVQNICAHLDVPFDERLLERGDGWWPWRDENRKYE